MARVSISVLAVVLGLSIARADKPPEPVEDPKVAIRERGIVFKVGKRHHLVIVPPAQLAPTDNPPPGSKLFKSTIYFGDGKTLYQQAAAGWTTARSGFDEAIGLGDPRSIVDAELRRKGDRFELECETRQEMGTERAFSLTSADARAVQRATIRSVDVGYVPHLFARLPNGTTYLYVDTPRASKHKEFRLFVGKRGAMKRLAVKEIANDSDALVLVTAKGTLTYKTPYGKPKQCETKQATFGTSKKTEAFDVLDHFANSRLIYQELGVYPSALTGFPCDEL